MSHGLCKLRDKLEVSADSDKIRSALRPMFYVTKALRMCIVWCAAYWELNAAYIHDLCAMQGPERAKKGSQAPQQ